MSFRAALIGCGKIGSSFADDPLLQDDVYTHAEAYACSTATELVAVCDSDPDKAASCAARWSVPAGYSDAAEMLRDAEPEIVSICTPDDTHYELARLGLDAPSVRALLCEKPLATNLEQGKELVSLARDRGKLLAVAYVRRYAENLQRLHEFLRQGSIGKIRAVSGWYTKGVLHNGTHWFDLLQMLTGEVAWVEASNRLGENGPDPTLDVTLGLDSGGVATLHGIDSGDYTIFEMDILTDAGRASITDGGHTIRVFHARPSSRYSGYTELAAEPHDFGDMRNLFLRAVDDVADALATGRDPLCSGEDGIAALRIGTAALKAAESGRRIGISTGLPQLG